MPSSQIPIEKDEKNVSLFLYQQAIDHNKKDFDDIQNKILLASSQLSLLKDRITKETNEFERWKRSEKQKFQDEMGKIQNDIIAKQNQINNEVIQQQRITADIRFQQEKYETLKQDQLKVKEELVKIEGKKIEIEDLHKQAQGIRDSALNLNNQGSMALQQAAKEKEDNKQENIRLSSLNDNLCKRELKLNEDMKAHQALKEFVEPKIRDIKEQQEALEIAKRKNEETIAKLNATMNEEKILLASIQDKKSKLEKDIKAFESEKNEFYRQKTLTEGLK